MERVQFKNSRGLTLVGTMFEAGSDAAIILAHGFTSDKSSLGRFDALAEALNRLGYNVLAFDFSGCGESDPEILSSQKMVDDLRSAITHVCGKGRTRVALYGHSLGGLICLRCSSPEVVTIIASSTATDSMNYNWEEYYSRDQLAELAQKGYFRANDRTGKERLIGLQMLKDFEEISQAELMKNVTCPVLLIHGNNVKDKEELQLLERSQRGMSLLPQGSELEIVKSADHTYFGHWDKVIAIAGEWYSKHLPVF